MNLYELATVCALELRRKKRMRRKKRLWVHPITSQRLVKGQFHKIYQDLRTHSDKFFLYFRMSINSFDELLDIITPYITYKDTKWRKAITPAERLSVTLRYLATGNSFRSLYYEFLIGETTLRKIVKDTCEKLWMCLKKKCMPEKTEEMWRQTAERFVAKTNFPHCLGAIDGKHIRIRRPNRSGSEFMNYKQFFSIVVMAIVDANYSFISVDIGSYGSASDSHIFQRSNFGSRLRQGQLNLPSDQPLPNDPTGPLMPFVFVADEAFALTEHVQRPFGRRNLSVPKRIFNYRLSRARRMVECAFGIMANKWRILHRALDVNISFCDSIVKACCILHNFVRQRDGIRFEDTLYECPLSSVQPTNVRGGHAGTKARDYFLQYFTSPQGSIPWQYQKI